jgi:hypothetical protein
VSYSIDTTSYPSNNFSARPGGIAPDMIVLHDGEGNKDSDLARLRNDRVIMEQRVSAHYYVDRAANVYQMIDPAREAWHAGVSFWDGRHNLNPYSIGIETEHRAGQDWPEAQQRQIGALCSYLISRYHIPQKYVVCHRWVAPGRKSDPTDWPDAPLKAFIASLYAPPIGPTPDAPQPFRFRFPQAVFTAPDPVAPLASGPVNGATLYSAGSVVQIGQIKDGWAWIKTGPGRLDGPGFVPLSILEEVQ